MKRLTSILTVALALCLVALPTDAQAQVDVKLGPRLGLPVGDLSDAEASVFLGADARIQSDALPVVLHPSFDYYLFDEPEGVDISAFALDLNALYEFGIDNEAFTPYAGGGLAITQYSTETEQTGIPGGPSGSFDTTEVGLNVLGGARFMLDPVEPFAQLNLTVGSDIDRIGITAGVLFGL